MTTWFDNVKVVDSASGEEVLVDDPETGDPVPPLDVVGDQAWSINFSIDDSRLVVLDQDGQPTVWSTEDWSLISDDLPGIQPPLAAIRYSPDGRHLVSLDQVGRVVLSDPISHEVLRAFESPSRLNMPEGALAFDAAGRYMLAIGGPSITLWDLEAGEQIGTSFPNDRGNVAFIQDGDDHPQLVTAEGQVRMIWDLDVENWLETACSLAGRNMTVAEWAQFGPRDEEYQPTCTQWPSPSSAGA